MMKALMLTLLTTVLPLNVMAQESEDLADKASPIKKVISYHKIKPDITTNLDLSKGIDGKNKMYNLMIRFSLMSDTQEDADILKTHEALYLDKIILFINKQKKESLKTRRQKTQFKKTLKNILNTTLQAELKKPVIIKRVLFTRMLID